MAEGRVGIGAKKKFRQSMNPEQPYSMALPKLGHAVIINNIASELSGSNEDVKALKESYETVGFEVQVHENCSAQRMREIKRWIMDKDNHKDCNSFLLTIICHGNKQGHLLDKHKSFGLNTEDFVGDLSVVETLLGKPKLLIIQSCKGGKWSTGQPVPVGTLAEDEDLSAPHIVADKADLFLAYATVPGYRAYGGDEDGSVYLQAFATFLQDHYLNIPLDRIYLMVKRAMIEAKQGDQGLVQASEERNSLTRVLHFAEYHKENTPSVEIINVKEMEQSKSGPLGREMERLTKDMEEKMKIAESEEIKKPKEQRKTVPPRGLPPKITAASQLKWKVIDTVNTGLNNKSKPKSSPLSDGTVVVLGQKKKGVKNLKQFHLKYKTEMFSEVARFSTNDITEIELAGKPALAISYGYSHTIEFRNFKNLSEIIKTFATGSLVPDALCTASPSTLLFLDESKLPHDVYWLDCSSAKPKLMEKKIVTELKYTFDICYAPDEVKPLLIGADIGSANAYNCLNNEMEWGVGMHGDSLTTDGKYLLVCSYAGNGIEMFSLSDGKNLGYLITKGQNGLGTPRGVRWCDATSSLVVAHEIKKKIHISTIKFD